MIFVCGKSGLIGGFTLLLLSACTQQQSAAPVAQSVVATTAASPAAQAGDASHLVATIQDIMDSAVDPSADYLWESVSTTVNKKGIDERRPRSDKEWHEVRRRAVLLAEAANLIAMPGRRVARGSNVLEDGAPLDTPAIQKRLDANPAALAGFADALRSTSVQLLDAIDRRDVAALTDLGGTLDEVCEACHRTYWYPDDPPLGGTAKADGGKAAAPLSGGK